MPIDVRRLRLLREVAHRGTIAAAADALSYTPSAVSQQLSTLEKEVGSPLLERTGRGVRLTDDGWMLVRHGDTVFAELERAEAALEASRRSVGGRLRVAAFSSVTTAVLAPTVARLATEYPELEVAIAESDPPDALRDLRLGELDVVVGHEYDHLRAAPDPELHQRELFAEAMFVAAPVGRFPPGRPVAMAELAGEPWAMSGLRTDCGRAVRAACRAAGFEPDIRYEFTEFGVVLRLVSAGLAVALLPELAFSEVEHGYEVHPLADGGLRRRVFTATRLGNRDRPAVVAFLDALDSSTAAFTAREERPGVVSAR
jgi:molybdate transport repressor ModE-like protein